MSDSTEQNDLSDRADRNDQIVEITATRALSGTKTLGEWITLLEAVGREDELSDASFRNPQKKPGRALVYSIFGWGLFGFGLTRELPGILIFLGFAVGVVFLIVFILGRQTPLEHEAVDFSNDFRESVLPVLKWFAEEFGDTANMLLRMDLSLHNTGEKKVTQADFLQTMTEIERQDPLNRYYLSPWCEALAISPSGKHFYLEVIVGSVAISSVESRLSELTSQSLTRDSAEWSKFVTIKAAYSPGSASEQLNNAPDLDSPREISQAAERRGVPLVRTQQTLRFESLGELEGAENCVPPETIIGMYSELMEAAEQEQEAPTESVPRQAESMAAEDLQDAEASDDTAAESSEAAVPHETDEAAVPQGSVTASGEDFDACLERLKSGALSPEQLSDILMNNGESWIDRAAGELGNFAVRDKMKSALLSLGASAVPHLIDHLADFNLSYDIRDTLGRLNPDAAKMLVTCLEKLEDPRTLKSVLEIVGQLKPEGAAERLKGYLRHDDHSVRYQAESTLRRLGLSYDGIQELKRG